MNIMLFESYTGSFKVGEYVMPINCDDVPNGIVCVIYGIYDNELDIEINDRVGIESIYNGKVWQWVRDEQIRYLTKSELRKFHEDILSYEISKSTKKYNV